MIDIRVLRPDERETADAAAMLSRLDQPSTDYLVAWLGDVPVGHAAIDWRADPPEIQDVQVRDEHRRLGIGRALTDAAVQLVRDRGGTSVALTVSVENAPARALYAQAGFEPDGEPPKRVLGTIVVRGRPLEVDDTLLTLVKQLA